MWDHGNAGEHGVLLRFHTTNTDCPVVGWPFTGVDPSCHVGPDRNLDLELDAGNRFGFGRMRSRCEWSGREWSGREWSGREWCGRGWCGAAVARGRGHLAVVHGPSARN